MKIQIISYNLLHQVKLLWKLILNLRNHPLYQIDEFTYSIVDPFFVLDKFTKSVKFILKESFNKKNNLNEKDRTFFNFYNKEFSEEYLMKKLLDDIFFKKYYIKQNDSSGNDKQPDYYYRYNNDIFIFEYKDVLIAKKLKHLETSDRLLMF